MEFQGPEGPDGGRVASSIACLPDSDTIERTAAFPFFRLWTELRFMVYEEHFRDYDPVCLDDREVYERNRAGINLVFTCRQIYDEALPLLGRNMHFHMPWEADIVCTNGHHPRYLDVADRLSMVGRNIANRIVTMRLDVYIDVECAALIGVNWTGLRTMESLRRLDVAFRFPDGVRGEVQAAYCQRNYGRSLFVTALIDGMVGALPAQCVLRWLTSSVGSDQDNNPMFVPPNLQDLRRRVNPYRGGSSTNPGVEIVRDFPM